VSPLSPRCACFPDFLLPQRIEDLAEDPDITVDELELGQVLLQHSDVATSSISTAESPLTSPTTSSAQPSSSTAQIPHPPSLAPLSNAELMAKCHVFVEQLREGAAPWVVQKMNESYGPMPTNPANFSFWMAMVYIPVDTILFLSF
jgi:hypothetical protein